MGRDRAGTRAQGDPCWKPAYVFQSVYQGKDIRMPLEALPLEHSRSASEGSRTSTSD
jgi:hypothetical protein